jgi:hypothetical protein
MPDTGGWSIDGTVNFTYGIRTRACPSLQREIRSPKIKV